MGTVGDEGAGLRRIETLIPYKEPTFDPKVRIGKLNLANSAWAISAKLGRFLLSGADPQAMGELSCVVADFFYGAGEEGLTPIGPADLDDFERTWFGGYAGHSSLFRAPARANGELPALVIVAHDKAKKRELGDKVWSIRYRRREKCHVIVLKLPTALGLMELVSAAGGRQALKELVRRCGHDSYLEAVAEFRKKFQEWDANGMVERLEPKVSERGSSGSKHWAKVTRREEDGSLYIRWLGAKEKLMLEATEVELEAAAQAVGEHHAASAWSDVIRLLEENRWADSGGLHDAVRRLAEERWDDEACREENRRYKYDEHIAGVFTDKKNCSDRHRAAAASGYLAESFRHVEIDDDVDLGEYWDLALEFEARDKAGEIPQVTKADHALRFRKCGRHHAIGVYSPLLKAVAVDPRAPRSLLHEFAHAYDFENGLLSISEGFAPILKAFRSELDTHGLTESQVKYYRIPTEVFARSWEVYASLNGYGGSFVAPAEEYRDDPAYAPLLAHADALEAYFGEFARPRHPVVLPTEPERDEEPITGICPSEVVEVLDRGADDDYWDGRETLF